MKYRDSQLIKCSLPHATIQKILFVMPQGSAVTSDTPPIYLLPGMTGDYPVYSRLTPLLPNASIVNFIAPKPNESLTAYAERMADRFPPQCYIAGVSFGGILALEISRIVQPAGCILISSLSNPNEMPPWLRVWRVLGGRNCSRILNAVGDSAALVPNPFAPIQRCGQLNYLVPEERGIVGRHQPC